MSNINNSSQDSYIEFRFNGGQLKPENVKASEVADILKSIEDVIETNVFSKYPELDKNQLVISLVDIKSESLGLQFKSPVEEYTEDAFRVLADAVNNNETISLPYKSRNALSNIVRFTKNKSCTAEMIISKNNHYREMIATITPETNVDYPSFLKGETTIYARVVRTGGKEPKAEIETIDGQTLYCNAPFDVTRHLGSKLYQIVGLVGIAEWNIELDIIENFQIQSVTDYEDVPFKEAIRKLADIVKDYYKDIDDVEKHIAGLRGQD